MAEIDEAADQAKKESMKKEEHVLKTGEYSGGQQGRDDIEQEDMQGKRREQRWSGKVILDFQSQWWGRWHSGIWDRNVHDILQLFLIRFMDEYAKRQEEDDGEVYEYDEDGNIIWTWKKVEFSVIL